MTSETQTLTDNSSFSFPMMNGVYYTHRTDYTDNAAHAMGYVENGSLTQDYIDANISVSYDTTTHTLTIAKPNSAWLGVIDARVFVCN